MDVKDIIVDVIRQELKKNNYEIVLDDKILKVISENIEKELTRKFYLIPYDTQSSFE